MFLLIKRSQDSSKQVYCIVGMVTRHGSCECFLVAIELMYHMSIVCDVRGLAAGGDSDEPL